MILLRDRQGCSSHRKLLDHRMPEKAPNVESLLSSSAHSYLDASSRSEVADTEARLGPDVTLIQFSSTTQVLSVIW